MSELNRDQIVKALECCSSSVCVSACESGCPYWGEDYDTCPCTEDPNFIVKKALSLIKELTEENERLRADLSDAEAKTEKAIDIAEDNIRAEIASGGTSCHWCEDKVKADTVRQMRPAIIEEVIIAVDKAFERQIYDSKWIDDKLEVVGFADIGYAIECWDEYIKPELIKKFEVENRLKECENGCAGTLFHDRCKLHDAEEKINELGVDLKAMRGAANSYKIHIIELTQAHEMLSESYDHLEKTKDDLLSERARLTEENERLHASCTELEKKYALAVAEREADVKGFSKMLVVIHDDTVRKMQERLTKEFDRMHKSNFITVEERQWIIDQIAKEMIGEERCVRNQRALNTYPTYSTEGISLCRIRITT